MDSPPSLIWSSDTSSQRCRPSSDDTETRKYSPANMNTVTTDLKHRLSAIGKESKQSDKRRSRQFRDEIRLGLDDQAQSFPVPHQNGESEATIDTFAEQEVEITRAVKSTSAGCGEELPSDNTSETTARSKPEEGPAKLTDPSSTKYDEPLTPEDRSETTKENGAYETDRGFDEEAYHLANPENTIPNERPDERQTSNFNYSKPDQAIRDRRYLVIPDDYPDGYTEGPARLVIAFDGLIHCPALLMPYQLSKVIQKAVYTQRRFAQEDRSAARLQGVWKRYGARLDLRILDHTSKILEMEKNSGPGSEHELRVLREEVHTLQSMQQDLRIRASERKAYTASKQDMAHTVLAKAHAILEEAFVNAHLVASDDQEPESPLQEMYVQEEYQKFKRQMQVKNDEDPRSVTPLHTDDEILRAPIVPLTPKQQLRQDRHEEFVVAQDRFTAAQRAFDDRNKTRAFCMWNTREGSDPVSISTEGLDCFWVQRFQMITHELIEAEKGLEEAKVALEATGEVLVYESESLIQHDSSLSPEEIDELMTAKDRGGALKEQFAKDLAPRVPAWLSTVRSPLSPSKPHLFWSAHPGSPGFNIASPTFHPRSPRPGESWKEGEEDNVDMGDSVSVVAQGSYRKKIDKWKRICGI